MSQRFRTFANTAAGRAIVTRLGLPDPVRPRGQHPGEPLVSGPVRLGGGDRLRSAVAGILKEAGVAVVDGGTGLAALVFDGTGLREPAALRALFEFFHSSTPGLAAYGRVIVLGTPPPECRTPGEAAAQQALAGFVSSVGPEFGRGTTAQVVYVSVGAEDMMESTLRFLLSTRSAGLSGQAIHIAQGGPPASTDWARPLTGQVALVTGAGHGIGAAVATVLARDGAQVVCVDRPGAVEAVAAEIGGTAIGADLAAAATPRRIADGLRGGVDIIVHCGGYEPDQALVPLTAARWDSVLEANLGGPERVNAVLLGERILRTGGRIVAVSPVPGPAGRRHRADHATAQAGVRGQIEAQARTLAKHSVTANAVTLALIETPLTAAIPALTRELGRRLGGAGLDVDVAETVGWLAAPASGGVTGNIVRIRGHLQPGVSVSPFVSVPVSVTALSARMARLFRWS
jgi:3-oxoacyl-[acyl-carrier protein] reductase